MQAVPQTDHLGNEYPSAGAMMAAYNVNRATFLARIAAGDTLEQALRPAKSTSCRDHLGNEYPSRSAMARAWGLEAYILKNRLDAGMGLKDALETPAGREPVKDHTGQEFPDITHMARAWHLDPNLLTRRMKKGWELKHALETPPGQIPGGRVKDHTGKSFRNTKEMLDKWGIEKGVYKKRIKNGMTLKEALETPVAEAIRPMPQKDHEGTEFPSIAAMCRHYGISNDVYTHRINAGWSLEDALCTPMRDKAVIQDWAGRIYGSIGEMSRTIHVGVNFIRYRWMGFTGQENAAARACILHWPGMDAAGYRIRECVAFPWFLCEELDDTTDAPHTGEVILHADRILELFRQEACADSA